MTNNQITRRTDEYIGKTFGNKRWDKINHRIAIPKSSKGIFRIWNIDLIGGTAAEHFAAATGLLFESISADQCILKCNQSLL